MFFYSFLSMFLICYFIGIYYCLFNDSGEIYWFFIEFSLIFFLPFLSKGKFGSLRRIKYFLIQSVGSFIFLISLINNFFNYYIFLVSSLILKLGARPFHQWVFYVVRGINWFRIFILLTLIKLIPFIVLLKFIDKFTDLILVYLVFCVIIGILGGIGQSSLRFLVVYSSIAQIGWIFLSIILSYSFFLYYLFIYFSLIYFLYYSLNLKNIYYFSQILKFNWVSIYILIIVLRIRGIPPFSIFLLKINIITIVFKFFNTWFLVYIVIFISLISLFYYIRLIILLFLNRSIKVKIKNLTKIDFNFFKNFFISIFFILFNIFRYNLFLIFL